MRPGGAAKPPLQPNPAPRPNEHEYDNADKKSARPNDVNAKPESARQRS